MKEGEEQTVEFKVAKVTGTGDLVLRAEAADMTDGFSTHIGANLIQTPADRARAMDFAGKTVRVRGKIHRDPQAGLYIEVASLRHIIAVGR